MAETNAALYLPERLNEINFDIIEAVVAQGYNCNATPLEGIIFYLLIFSFGRSGTNPNARRYFPPLHATTLFQIRRYTECLITRFPLPTLAYAGYSVKLQQYIIIPRVGIGPTTTASIVTRCPTAHNDLKKKKKQ